MIHLVKHKLSKLFIGALPVVFLFLIACTNDELTGDSIWGPNHCLLFTDNDSFEYGKPERITVNSSAQTIELNLKNVRGTNEPRPTELYVKVYEWDTSCQDYKEISRFDKPAEFYKAFTENNKGESTIKIELTENNQETERKILVFITSEIIVNHSLQVGYVEIIQQPI